MAIAMAMDMAMDKTLNKTMSKFKNAMNKKHIGKSTLPKL